MQSFHKKNLLLVYLTTLLSVFLQLLIINEIKYELSKNLILCFCWSYFQKNMNSLAW